VKVFALSAMLLLAVSPAFAQRTGTRLDRNRDAVSSVSKLDATSAIRAQHQFGLCIARRERIGMVKALELPMASAEQSKAITQRIDLNDGCLGSSDEFDTLVTKGPMLSGAIAEWFVRTDYKTTDLKPLSGMNDEALMKTPYAPRNLMEDLGLCILRRDPAATRALFETKPVSEEEKAAFALVQPNVGPCLLKGETMKLNIPNLRAVLAYATYRAASKLGKAS
jgi:hypothetical protein